MDDTKIIDLYWAKNQDAIHETDIAYGKKLHALAYKILNNREDAEESVSDTYMKTWQIIPPQRPNYLYGVIKRITPMISWPNHDSRGFFW